MSKNKKLIADDGNINCPWCGELLVVLGRGSEVDWKFSIACPCCQVHLEVHNYGVHLPKEKPDISD